MSDNDEKFDGNDPFLPVPVKIGKINVNYPSADGLVTEKERSSIVKSLNEDAYYLRGKKEDNKNNGLKLGAGALSSVLGTTKPVANRLISKAPEKEVVSIEGKECLSAGETMKVLTEWQEQPRTFKGKDKRNFGQKCIASILNSNSFSVDQARDKEAIECEMKKAKQRKRKSAQGRCEVTGETSSSLDVHHLEPYAIDPRKGSDDENLAVMLTDLHVDNHLGKEDAVNKVDTFEKNKKGKK